MPSTVIHDGITVIAAAAAKAYHGAPTKKSRSTANRVSELNDEKTLDVAKPNRLASSAPAIAAKKAEMQKTSRGVVLTEARFVWSGGGESASARRSRPRRLWWIAVITITVTTTSPR